MVTTARTSCSSPRSWLSRLPAKTQSRYADLPDAAPTVDRERPEREQESSDRTW